MRFGLEHDPVRGPHLVAPHDQRTREELLTEISDLKLDNQHLREENDQLKRKLQNESTIDRPTE